jgi:hypothetical protein
MQQERSFKSPSLEGTDIGVFQLVEYVMWNYEFVSSPDSNRDGRPYKMVFSSNGSGSQAFS